MDVKLLLQILGGLLVLGFLVWAVKDFGKFEAKQQRVFQEGIRGEGTVVDVKDGTSRKGQEREVVLTLDITSPGRPPLRAQASVFAGPIKARELVPGLRLPVLVDPVDASRVVVDPASGFPPAR
ncbi:hypothetical protein [Polyangium fumosum]|uniref:DUF3592 domain-containing protein n=1 Tax=Polyangium fumosum TaxID=889272 RepID=A0A4V5PLN5_9BACT|nr:hypothetical protein [Polyangium fumosum]TKD00090.1 hypothetical protein E8A74_35645 [Polyangium fumosum]